LEGARRDPKAAACRPASRFTRVAALPCRLLRGGGSRHEHKSWRRRRSWLGAAL